MDKRKGYLVLEGGAEFGGEMAEPDRRALNLAGGLDSSVCILPTAAVPDNNHERAGGNGVRWFKSLGAQETVSLPIINRASANDPALASALRQARLVYLLGGFTGYLGQTLVGSLGWQAILQAYAAGAVIAGSSAGAMVLCQHYFDPEKGQVKEGLNLVARACVLPHHNTFGKRWSERLAVLLPEHVLVGIDERTGMIDDGEGGLWQVYGRGAVTLYHKGKEVVYSTGERFSLDQ